MYTRSISHLIQFITITTAIQIMIKPKESSSQFSKFLLAVANASLFSVPLLPRIEVDTTSTRPLKEIYHSTRGDSSDNGQILNYTSGKLLTILQQVGQEYASLDSQMQKKWKEKAKKPSPIKLPKKGKELKTFNQKYLEVQEPLMEQNQNNQNVNLSNHQLTSNNFKPSTKPLEIYQQIRQINRPQYRKVTSLYSQNKTQQNHISDHSQIREDTAKNLPQNTLLPNHQFQQPQQEEQQVIPILSNRLKKTTYQPSPLKSDRSVSPKVERKVARTRLNSISSISKHPQTGSDISFEIDLNSMGILPQEKQGQVSGKRKINQFEAKAQYPPYPYPQRQIQRKKQKYTQPNFRQNTEQDEIQEQQPWQCDQEQIQEELRQINERLSYRPYQTQNFNTQNDFQLQSQTHRDPSPQVVKKKERKETKTVRLSLTPNKKSNPYRKKGVQVKNRVLPKEEDQEEIECSQWNRPKKGLITVDILKLINNK